MTGKVWLEPTAAWKRLRKEYFQKYPIGREALSYAALLQGLDPGAAHGGGPRNRGLGRTIGFACSAHMMARTAIRRDKKLKSLRFNFTEDTPETVRVEIQDYSDFLLFRWALVKMDSFLQTSEGKTIHHRAHELIGRSPTYVQTLEGSQVHTPYDSPAMFLSATAELDDDESDDHPPCVCQMLLILDRSIRIW